MKRIFYILFFIFISINCFSQDRSVKRNYKQADNLILQGNLEKALEIYKKIIADYPDNSNYNYKIGFIYFEASGLRDNATEFLEKASLNISDNYNNNYKESSAPVETLYYLGLLYHYKYEFEKAKEYFNKYLEQGKEESKIEEVKELINACDNGIDLVMNPLDLDIIELGGNINSKYEEHSPLITADLKTLIFTSKRKGTGGDKDENGDYYEDVYISHFENGDWTEPASISTNINTEDHEASSGLSYDGRT
jgi:tetratricopeptide (TPR) repeat protein